MHTVHGQEDLVFVFVQTGQDDRSTGFDQVFILSLVTQ